MSNFRLTALALTVTAAFPALSLAQSQTYYNGTEVTGQLTLTRTVNVLQAAQPLKALGAFSLRFGHVEDSRKFQPKLLPPNKLRAMGALAFSLAQTSVTPPLKDLSVVVAAPPIGFNGITHQQQLSANNGNQFSVEPPTPGVAVANGFELEGVNNAIQVYDSTGNPLLPQTLSTNQLFGVAPAIIQSTGANGVYPTDMRVFYDPDIERWFVLQRAQDNDIAGNLLSTSHFYFAVSQTADPTGTYNIYTQDTTNSAHPGCPCYWDYPQIGADRYGFYISANEYSSISQTFVDATITAISKASLATGALAPTAYNFTVPFTSGYEFSIHPATTPPGAYYFVGNGGLEYFASTVSESSGGNRVAIWAMTNTGSLAVGQPNPTLSEITVPTMPYATPFWANQPDGSRPYGMSFTPPEPLLHIDGGDCRVLSVSYTAGRLHLTFATSIIDQNGLNLVGGAWIVLSPTYRNNVLAARVLYQDYLTLQNNHILRPSIAVDAHGRGVIAATVVGPDWYPSAAFIPVNNLSTPSTIQIAAAGTLPEDGFSGDLDGTSPGIASWGDNSSAVVAGDGSIWTAVEYIANLPRSQYANWDTFVMQSEP